MRNGGTETQEKCEERWGQIIALLRQAEVLGVVGYYR